MRVYGEQFVWRTDKWEIRVDPREQVIRFFPLRIYLGEIIPASQPKFRLRRRDFPHQEDWERIIAWMEAWKKQK